MRKGFFGTLVTTVFVLSVSQTAFGQESAPDPDQPRSYAAALGAHHICSGTLVVGRDYERTPAEVVAQDLAPFPAFGWAADFEYDVDMTSGLVTVSAPDIPDRHAKYTGDQGCVILPVGDRDVSFEPVEVMSSLPDAAARDWPTGDRDAYATLPPRATAHLDSVLDAAMEIPDQNTRALVVVYDGKIVGERFAPGFTRRTPQISWSEGKSITAALIGVLVQQGHFHWTDPAPVPEWQGEDDPRREITIANLLNMSSGLDFQNHGLDPERSMNRENEHFLIYFDGIDVFEHAINQPMDLPPNTERRYRNSDPLTLGRIVRQTVEGRGDSYHQFPQHDLFDRIGMRNVVLETDPYGNFILTGYDYVSAWDWARFGLLHLWDGVWDGERILPEGWVEFISTPAPADQTLGYGGLFWLNRGGAYSRVPEDAYWPAGYMGQQTVIVPSRNAVIVRQGPSAGGFGPYFNEVLGGILDALPN